MSVSKLKELSKLQCITQDHEKSTLTYVCINENCDKQRLSCAQCILENHSNHTQDKIQLQNFFQMFKGKYEDRYKRIEDIEQLLLNSKDKNLLEEYQESIIQQVDKLEKQMVSIIQSFKQSISVYLKRFSEVKAYSEIYKNFKLMDNTVMINDFIKNGINKDANIVRRTIDIYFDKNYDGQVDTTLINLRNYFSALDELKNQIELNQKVIEGFERKIHIYLENNLKELGENLSASVLKILGMCQQQPKISKDLNSSSLSDEGFDKKQLQTINIDRRYIKRNKNSAIAIICKHYETNYIPVFKCCPKQYPCYICHDSSEKHKHQQVSGAICLICKNISFDFNKCDQCGARFYMVM